MVLSMYFFQIFRRMLFSISSSLYLYFSFFIILLFLSNISILSAYEFSGKVDYGIGTFKNVDLNNDNIYKKETMEYNQALIYSVLLNLSIPNTPIIPEIEISRVIIDTTNNLKGKAIDINSLLKIPNKSSKYISQHNISINSAFINATMNLAKFFVTPYIGLGLGKGIMNDNIEKDIEKNLMQAIAGASILLNNNVFLDLRYKLISTFLKPDFSIVKVNNENKATFLSLEESLILSNFLTLGIRVKF